MKLYYRKRLDGYVTIPGASLFKVRADTHTLEPLVFANLHWSSPRLNSAIDFVSNCQFCFFLTAKSGPSWARYVCDGNSILRHSRMTCLPNLMRR